MTETEKCLRDLEEMFKAGMISAEDYKNMVKQFDGIDLSGTASENPPPAAPPAATPPPMPEIPKIHLNVNGQNLGSFDRDVIIEKIRSGEIKRDAMVWQKGMDNWVKAGEWPVLENYFPEQPPPMPVETAPPLPSSAPPPHISNAAAGNTHQSEMVDPALDFAEAERRKAEEEAAAKRRAEQEAAQAKRKMDEQYSEAHSFYKTDKYRKAFPILKDLAECGHAGAQNLLAICYQNGYGTMKNLAKSIELFHKAIDQGNADAMYQLSCCYSNGRFGVEKDKAKCIEWCSKAAELGHEEAKRMLPLYKE